MVRFRYIEDGLDCPGLERPHGALSDSYVRSARNPTSSMHTALFGVFLSFRSGFTNLVRLAGVGRPPGIWWLNPFTSS